MPENRLAELDAAMEELGRKREWQLAHVEQRQENIARARAQHHEATDDAAARLAERTIHLNERELSLWTDAIKQTDADLAAKKRELDAEHRRVDRALASSAEAATVALIAEAYERVTQVLPPLEAQLCAVVESVRATVHRWGDVSLRERGNLTLRDDADDRLRGTTQLGRLLALLNLVQQVAGTVPVPERIVPPNPYARDESHPVVIELASPTPGLIMRTPQQVAERLARFRPVENT